MIDLSYIIPDMKARNMKIKTTNPYSKQSAMLTFEEYDLYGMIKRAEKRENYKLMQEGLDKFSRMNPKAYMVLLD